MCFKRQTIQTQVVFIFVFHFLKERGGNYVDSVLIKQGSSSVQLLEVLRLGSLKIVCALTDNTNKHFLFLCYFISLKEEREEGMLIILFTLITNQCGRCCDQSQRTCRGRKGVVPVSCEIAVSIEDSKREVPNTQIYQIENLQKSNLNWFHTQPIRVCSNQTHWIVCPMGHHKETKYSSKKSQVREPLDLQSISSETNQVYCEYNLFNLTNISTHQGCC